MIDAHATVPRTWRMPRPWTVVALGYYHEHAVFLTLLLAVIPFVIVGRVDGLPAFVSGALILAGLVLLSGGARHAVLAPLTRWLKRYPVSQCSVIYFRSFDGDESHAARDLIAPILGCIGRLTTIHNTDYIQGLTGSEGHDQNRDALAAWLELGEILADGLAAIRCETDTWRDEVLRRLSTADLVVIDVTFSSENLVWELAQARNRLPTDRVIVIRAADGDAALPEPETGGHAPVVYRLDPKGRRALRRALRAVLKSIRSGNRPG